MPRILGIDHGTRRIGLALSDEQGIIATPLGTVHGTEATAAAAEIGKICAEKRVSLIVVGLPLNMDGSAGPSAAAANEFAKALRDKIGLPVETLDERLSTSLVERALLEGDARRSKRRDVRDRLAAQVILQGYLDRKNSVAPQE